MECVRKLVAARDSTPEDSHISYLLCLLPPRFNVTIQFILHAQTQNAHMYATLADVIKELKLDDDRHKSQDQQFNGTDDSDQAFQTCVVSNSQTQFNFKRRKMNNRTKFPNQRGTTFAQEANSSDDDDGLLFLTEENNDEQNYESNYDFLT
ncbi:hypothetical protein THRCLA_09129 [Thraustotheca clavata]|uniref:Uncharacterized protein n=1 Tax=Thraustotheca clavata TaxID=74557 RepID=A0A1V9YYV8_9STRA|nr:hypothetical protein THRCLA_09129 [Thraustotheca clavata]